MKNTSTIRFAYDGYYSSIGEGVRWILKEDEEVHSFCMKSSIGKVYHILNWLRRYAARKC
ncbi:unnamed protein product [Arabidopsis halleri]